MSGNRERRWGPTDLSPAVAVACKHKQRDPYHVSYRAVPAPSLRRPRAGAASAGAAAVPKPPCIVRRPLCKIGVSGVRGVSLGFQRPVMVETHTKVCPTPDHVKAAKGCSTSPAALASQSEEPSGGWRRPRSFLRRRFPLFSFGFFFFFFLCSPLPHFQPRFPCRCSFSIAFP